MKRQYENSYRIFVQIPGRADISYVAEDFGSQESLLIRPSLIRSIFIPRMKRIIDLVHEAGAYVFFHSDGAVREILPDMVTAGIDILNPVQWRCKGVDREELKCTFGQRLVFHGGVDNQHTLPMESRKIFAMKYATTWRSLERTAGISPLLAITSKR